MTDTELTTVICTSIWCAVAMIVALVVYRIVDKKYRKFYIHPLVGLIKDVENDTVNHYGHLTKIILYILYGALWLPITLEWALAWLLYRWSKLLIDQYVEVYTSETTDDDALLAEMPEDLVTCYSDNTDGSQDTITTEQDVISTEIQADIETTDQ